MIVTVNSQQFAQALRFVSKTVPTQPAIQILGHVLLVAGPEGLRLSATDLEVSASVSCAATVTAPGACALPALTFLQLIEQFSDGTITIMSDAQGARVEHGTFVSRLQVLPVAEFPTLPVAEGPMVQLSGIALAKLISLTRYAVAERGKKFILEGALLKLTGTSMGMVATDGARLSIATATRVAGQPDFAVTIPRKTLDMLSILDTGPIELVTGDNHLFFTSGSKQLISRTIEGNFPAYERMIPRDTDKTVIVERARLAAALRRIGVASEKNYAAYVSISNGALRLTAKSVEIGEADEQVPAQYAGENLTVCINWKYLLDFLNASEGQTITINMKTMKSPLLLSDGVSFINILMTMRG